MQVRFVQLAVLLGLLSVIGPLAIDMYLPSLPFIARDLGAEIGWVQMSVFAYILAIGIFQIVYGPLSDMFGRKAPLYGGLVLYFLGSIGCALSPNIEMLVLSRFIQGAGACAGMVIPRAVVRDRYRGADAAKLMSLIMLVFAISPLLAPLFGSLFIESAGWRSVFWVTALIGLAGVALNAFLLPETRPPEARIGSGLGSAVRSYALLFDDRYFLGLSLMSGLTIAVFFSYIASASFVFIDHYGFTAVQFSIAFSINAAAFIAGTQLSGLLAGRFGLRRIVRVSAGVHALALALLLVVSLTGVDNAFVLLAFLFVAFGALGPIIPSTVVLALEDHPEIAGTASALMGTLQAVVGGLAIVVASLVFNGTPLPMVATIAAFGGAGFIVSRLVLQKQAEVKAAAE